MMDKYSKFKSKIVQENLKILRSFCRISLQNVSWSPDLIAVEEFGKVQP